MRRYEDDWELMASDLFPLLRRVDIITTLVEDTRSEEKIAEIGSENPENLSRRELMIFAANTGNDQHKEAALLNFAERFPASEEAYLNLSNHYFNLGRYQESLDILKKGREEVAEISREYRNNLAVSLTMLERYSEARRYFDEIYEAENKQFANNYAELLLQVGEYEKALDLYSEDHCSHNRAIAYLMVEKASEAREVLACKEDKTGLTHYLIAIASAELDDEDTLLSSLEQAVKMNAGFKEMAGVEYNFRPFRESDSFQNIIR